MGQHLVGCASIHNLYGKFKTICPQCGCIMTRNIKNYWLELYYYLNSALNGKHGMITPLDAALQVRYLNALSKLYDY